MNYKQTSNMGKVVKVYNINSGPSSENLNDLYHNTYLY